MILYFPSLCLPFVVGSHLNYQIPIPSYSLPSGKTQLLAVNSQFLLIPINLTHVDTQAFLPLSKYLVFLSLSKAHPLLAAAQHPPYLSWPSFWKCCLHALSALPPFPFTSSSPHHSSLSTVPILHSLIKVGLYLY